MDNRRASDKSRTPRRNYAPASRALAATGVLVLSVYALNLSGRAQELRPALSAVSPSGTADNAAGRADARSGKDAKGPAGVVLPAPDGHAVAPLPNSLLADPQALVPFPRASVAGLGLDAELSINLAGRTRPPAGYLMSPLDVLSPSSPYGYRVSPLSGEDGDFHLGQDYAAPCGTKVHAADSGTVRAAGWHPWGGGNRVEIDHGNGLVTTYNHLDSIAVERGDTVHAGEVIAKVGTTGWSTGCHLHFETILNGHHTSPLGWKLLPLKALLNGQMPDDLRSYLPRSGAPSNGTKDWPVSVPGKRETAAPRHLAPAAPSTSAPAAPTPGGPRYASTPAARSDNPASTGSGAAPATPGPPSSAASSPSSTVTPTTGPTPSQSAPPTSTPDPAQTTPAPAPAAPAPETPAVETAPALPPAPVETLPPILIDPTPSPAPTAPAPTATTPPPTQPADVPASQETQEPAAAESPVVAQPAEPAPAEPSAADPAATDPAATDPAATDPAATDPAATDPASGVTAEVTAQP